jgi:NitT/TauT family transport system substrate-binding protein
MFFRAVARQLARAKEAQVTYRHWASRRLVACGLVIISITGGAWAQGKGEKEKLRIGYAARAVAHSVPFVAREAGFFSEEGIDAEIIRTAGSIAPMALVANEVDLAIMSAYLMIPVAERNRDVVMLGGFSRYASMVFVSRPEVKDAQDLKGKVIGIQRPGDAYEKSARFALKHLGLDPDRDVKMLALGTNDVMWSALQTGKVAATILSPPGTLFARKAGMNFMVDLNDLKLEYQGSTITTRRSLILKKPALATRALRAIIRGVHLFKTRKGRPTQVRAVPAQRVHRLAAACRDRQERLHRPPLCGGQEQIAAPCPPDSALLSFCR